MAMATTNTQNTVQGSGGSQLIGNVGNSILDAFSQLTAVGTGVLGNLGSLTDQALLAKLRFQQLVNPPAQTPINYNNPADFLSNPENKQRLIMYALAGSALVLGGFYLYKKM